MTDVVEENSTPTGEELLAEAMTKIDVGDEFDDDLDDLDDLDDNPTDEGDDDDAGDDDGSGDGGDDSDNDAIARARQDGWRPKEEYNGPPGQCHTFSKHLTS